MIFFYIKEGLQGGELSGILAGSRRKRVLFVNPLHLFLFVSWIL